MSPSRSARPCSRPACGNLATPNSSRCEAHTKQDRDANDERRGTNNERGYDSVWSRVRSMKANRDPLCEACLLKNIERPLSVVHHIKDVEHYPELRLVMENLQSLCVFHHEAIHGKSRWKSRLHPGVPHD
jgi:5-methylcytosine-specific restriction protein A